MIGKPCQKTCTKSFSTAYGIPCSHQIEAYITLGQKVPIEAFHDQWRLTADPIPESLEALKADVQSQAEILCSLPENALRRACDELTKLNSGGYEIVPVIAPETKKNTRGRPSGSKKDRSKSKLTPRNPSGFEYLKTHEPPPNTSNPPAKTSKPPRKCSECKESGHYKNKCPLKPSLRKPTLQERQLDLEENTLVCNTEDNCSITEVNCSISTPDIYDPDLEDDNFDTETSQLGLSETTEIHSLDDQDTSESDKDNTECPFCDEPLPSQPSQKLQNTLTMLLKRLNKRNAVSLPVSLF